MLGTPQTLSSRAERFALWAEQSNEYVSSFPIDAIVWILGRPVYTEIGKQETQA